MTTSTKKLDHILGVGKSPCDKKGLGFEVSREISTLKKTVFVKSLEKIEASPVHTPRTKIDLGQCLRSAQVKVAPRRQPQAQRIRVSQINIPQQMTYNEKRPIMQPQVRKQVRPVQQRKWIEPTQPQRHRKGPMHAQRHGMISKFIPTCHFCGIDGHIRPNCFHYIKLCRIKRMIEKRKTRVRMHDNR